MATPKPTVLVVGATGKQGGAVIAALLKHPEPRPRILALTRNVNSSGAKALVEANQGSVELVQGDATDPTPIFESQPKGSVGGVFLVTTPGKVDEEKQAIPLIDAAVEHGVKHIVFSSVDRGGDDKSWNNPTDIKHFYQKHNIEVYLRAKASGDTGGTGASGPGSSAFTWTILRPTAFMENMNPGVFCSVFTAMWASALQPDTKLQLVSVHDIGTFAAAALSNPERWAGRAVGLAGAELTLVEAREKFKAATGKDLPESWTLVGSAVLWAIGEVGSMFAFFEREGYGVDIAALRKEESSLQGFETWLKESSKWKE